VTSGSVRKLPILHLQLTPVLVSHFFSPFFALDEWKKVGFPPRSSVSFLSRFSFALFLFDYFIPESTPLREESPYSATVVHLLGKARRTVVKCFEGLRSLAVILPLLSERVLLSRSLVKP